MAENGATRMIFGGAALAAVELGAVMLDPGPIVDPTSLQAITTELNGVNVRDFVQMDSLAIQDTLGQPATANFILLDPTPAPVVGDRVRILFHSQLIFAGTIDLVRKTTVGLQVMAYQCDCLDWSQILMRRMVRRNFTNMTAKNIVESLLNNELAGESLTIGTMDSVDTIPLVDVTNARAFDVCRTLAGITGQTFYVDFDRSIQMRSTSVPVAPLVLTESVVEIDGTTSQSDRESYRNVQRLIVTGTPLAGVDANVVTVERSNTDQIANRQAIEGGTGIYESYEEITHPTSNRADDLEVLGVGYANLRLSVSGVQRHTVQARVRSYGFRAGQLATVTLPTFGIVGTYILQRVTINEESGTRLTHDVELTSSSAQQRAYETWLEILQKGKIIVQGLFALVHSSGAFAAPGSVDWIVPEGVTLVTITVKGGSGGGAGGINSNSLAYSDWPDGGPGGNSGLVVSSLIVTAGDVLNIVIGGQGIGGPGSVFGSSSAGTAGAATSVYRNGVSIAIANPGGGGGAPPGGYANGAPGTPGGGSGSVVTVGGGRVGGAGGVGKNPASVVAPGFSGVNGSNGSALIEW